jgi:hypothetical protein
VDELKEGKEVRVVPNDILLDEVRRLVVEGHPVTIRVKGYSMLPFIIGDIDSVKLVSASAYKVDDIVLAEVGKGHYVLHRIDAITGSAPDDKVTLMGDGNLLQKEHCLVRHLAGRVETIYHLGKSVDPASSGHRFAVRCWLLLTPVRRWLLAIYRRTLLKYYLNNYRK